MKIILLLIILLVVLPIALRWNMVRRVLLFVSALAFGVLCVHVFAVACIFTYSLVHERTLAVAVHDIPPAAQGHP